MKRKRRNKFEVIADLLDECQTPKLLIRLMYPSTGSTTYTKLKKDVGFCLENGLLKPDGVPLQRGTKYETAQKGVKFLGHVRTLQELTRKEES